jgi:antirestriction protein
VTDETRLTLKITVACPSDTRNRTRNKVWVDKKINLPELAAAIEGFLKDEPLPNMEKWVILDSDGYGWVQSSEGTDAQKVHDITVFKKDHGEVAQLLLTQYGGDLVKARKALQENYNGFYKTLKDFVAQVINETYGLTIPYELVPFFEWEDLAEGMAASGCYFYLRGSEGYHVFSRD